MAGASGRKPQGHMVSPFEGAGPEGPLAEVGEAEVPLLPQDNDVKVGGRLREFATAWSGDKWAKSIVTQGLRWRWATTPPLLKELVPQKASEVLTGYVLEMLEKGVVVPFFGKGVQNHLFSRPKKGTDKLRVILNLSHLNDLIPCPSFKMVTVQDVRACLPERAWLTSIDLKDAYWHVPGKTLTPSRLCHSA